MLNEHHDGEEEILFPSLETRVGVPDLMKANVDEHEVFHEEVLFSWNIQTMSETGWKSWTQRSWLLDACSWAWERTGGGCAV